MNKKNFFQVLHDRLYAIYGECVCPLNHVGAFQLLAAVMLSAQCRDERVNKVTGKLFSIAPDAEHMSRLKTEEIEKIIHVCGLSGSKSRNLRACAEIIVEKYSGQVPATMEELTSLPGIGRKSANVILGNAFNIPGFPVDTHVKRVLNRLGIVKSDSPEKIEIQVTSSISPELWTNFSHMIIQHGRNVCHARNPECSNCPLKNMCSKTGVKNEFIES